FTRDAQTQRAQPFEEILIHALPRLAFGSGFPQGLALLWLSLAREHQVWRARRILHQREAIRREPQHGKLVADLLKQVTRDHLLDVSAQFVHRHRGEQAEDTQLIMAARRHRLCFRAAQDVDYVCDAEALADPRDSREDLARDHDWLADRLQLAEAEV